MVVGSPTKLNLIPSGVMPVVYINQGDAGYDKEFLIYNGDSPYNVPAGVSATIRGKKADGYGVTEVAVLTEGSNLVTVTITEQMVAAAGANLYELVFVDTDGLRIATINMVWAVKADALGDAVISDSDLNYVNEALDKIQGAEALKNQLDINTDAIAAETAARIAADNTLQSNINAEAATRAAADNAIQTNLNVESATRATQDASLQAQISQLVAPSGAAPSAAEVQNARIGANGITYGSLGDAIRSLDSEIMDATQNEFVEQNRNFAETLFPYADFVNGAVRGADGAINTAALGRIASSTIISLPMVTLLTAKPGYKFSLALFTNNTFTAFYNAQTSFKLAANQQFRISIFPDTVDDTTRLPIGETIGKVTFKNYFLNDLNAIKEALNSQPEFILGSTDGAGNYIATATRIVTAYIYKCSKGDRIRTNSLDVDFAADIFNSGFVHQTNTGWLKEYTVPADGYMRILMRYSNDSTIADISAVSSALIVNSKHFCEVIDKNNCVYPELNFTLGTVNSSTGNISATTTRIVSRLLIWAPKGTQFKNIANTVTVALALYDKDKKFIIANAFQRNNILDDDYFVRVTIRKENDATIDENEVNTLAAGLVIEGAHHLGIQPEDCHEISWVNGSTNSATGQIISVSSRITTVELVQCGKYSLLSSKSDSIDVACDLFDQFGNHVLNTGWLKSYIVPNDGYIRAVARYSNDSNISDISAVEKNVVMSLTPWASVPIMPIAKHVVADIAHRGMTGSTYYGENTVSAFRQARKLGFNYAETDIQWTSDGVPVCLHDETIDRTSTGSGNINSMTYEQANSYVYGGNGDGLLKFEDFLILCKKIGLIPYIELKDYTTYSIVIGEKYAELFAMVKRYFGGPVVWCSNSFGLLEAMHGIDGESDLVWFIYAATIENQELCATDLLTLKQNNKVIASLPYDYILEGSPDVFCDKNIPLHAFECDTIARISSLDSYISGVLSGVFVASNIIVKNGFSETM